MKLSLFLLQKFQFVQIQRGKHFYSLIRKNVSETILSQKLRQKKRGQNFKKINNPNLEIMYLLKVRQLSAASHARRQPSQHFVQL